MTLNSAHTIGQPGHTADHNLIDTQINTTLPALMDSKIAAQHATDSATYLPKAALGVVSLADYCVGDGTTDDTAGIIAALAALPASGGAVAVPAGKSYLYSAFTISKPVTFLGGGYTSELRCSSATGNGVTVTSAQEIEIRGIRFTASVTRSAGWFLDVASSVSRMRVDNVTMEGYSGGIRSAATATLTVERSQFFNGIATSGCAIEVDGGLDVSIYDCLVDAGAQIFAAVFITNAGDVTIDQCQLLHGGAALRVDVAAGKSVASLWATNTFFDNSSRGAYLTASGGSIVRARFDTCWFSSSTNQGILLATSSGGGITGVDISDCHVFGNGSNGIDIADTGVVGVRINDTSIAGHASGAGVNVAANVSDFAVKGCRIGTHGGFGVNLYGVYIGAGTGANYQVTDNDMRGNTTPLVDGGTGAATGRNVARNLGVAQGTTGGVTVTGSPFSYTAGAAHETVYINGGTVSLVTVDGVGVFQGTNTAVRLGPGKTVVISYSSAPGVAVTKD